MRSLTMVYGLVLATACMSSTVGALEPPAWTQQKFDLDFDGGTLNDFVAMLKDQTPEFNVVVAEDAQDVRVQALQLRNVALSDVLTTLEELLEPYIDMGPVPDRLDTTTPVILIRSDSRHLRTAAFSTKNISQGEGATDVVEAIEFAIESLPNHDRRSPPKVRAHEPSGILIVTADDDQLQLIAQVVVLLGGESRLTFGGARYYPMISVESLGVSQSQPTIHQIVPPSATPPKR